MLREYEERIRPRDTIERAAIEEIIIQRTLARIMTMRKIGIPNEAENLLKTNDLLDSTNPSAAGS